MEKLELKHVLRPRYTSGPDGPSGRLQRYTGNVTRPVRHPSVSPVPADVSARPDGHQCHSSVDCKDDGDASDG